MPGIALDALYRTRASTSISPEKSDNRKLTHDRHAAGLSIGEERQKCVAPVREAARQLAHRGSTGADE